MSGPILSIVAQAQAEPGLLEFFLRSGPMAKFVLGVLVAFSVVSWAIMIAKYVQFRRVARHTERFVEVFRASKRFSEVSASAAKLSASPLVGVFQAGYAEIDSQIKASAEENAAGSRPRYRIRSLSGVERSLRRSMGGEILVLSRGTQFLATTAAATPFIGLFGTVWGIMVAFRDIALTGSTSIVAVAPGIAEALINTAAGLAAAIPALVGYNYFANQLRRTRTTVEDFILEFLNLAERNFT